MADIIIKHRHNTVRAKTINQQQFEFEHMDQFYWVINEQAIVGRQMPIAVVGLRPEVYLPQPTSFWDWGLIYDACPSRRLSVISDSDDFLMLELRDDERSVGGIRFGRSSTKEIARRMKGYITQYQVDNAKFRLFLHSSDISAEEHDDAQNKLDEFVGGVLAKLPSKLPSHRHHAQWDYHKKFYAERLNLNLFRSQTKTGMPPLRKKEPEPRFSATRRSIERVRKRTSAIGHPFKSAAIDEVMELSNRGQSVLILCDDDSPLLTRCSTLQSLVSRVSLDDRGQDVLIDLDENVPKFDVVLIEVTSSSIPTLRRIFELACLHLFPKGTVVFLWSDRSDVPVSDAVTSIYKLVTHWGLEFRASSTEGAWGNLRSIAHSASHQKLRKSRLPLILAGIVAETCINLALRAYGSLRYRPPGPQVTGRAEFLLVETTVPENVRIQIDRTAPLLKSYRSPVSRSLVGIDLSFDPNPAFTKWITQDGLLNEPFVVLDIGVFGDHSPRWDFFGDHLVVYGFDVIEEEIEALRIKNRGKSWKNYHCMAIGAQDTETEIYFDPLNPTNTSLRPTIERITRKRSVRMRRLDTLLEQGFVTQPDFIKVDVEGAEGDVLTGSGNIIRNGILGAEIETNFDTSIEYPQTHFSQVQNLLLASNLKVADLNFDRVSERGRVSTFNVLFCNSLEQSDSLKAWRIGQLLKLISIYELYGLGDTAVNVVLQFQDQLGSHIDVERAVFLLSGESKRLTRSSTRAAVAPHQSFFAVGSPDTMNGGMRKPARP